MMSPPPSCGTSRGVALLSVIISFARYGFVQFIQPNQSKRSFEHGAKAMENLLGVKSLDKAIEVQSEYAKAAYEGYVAHATRLGELYVKLAKEAFKPYQGFCR
jgi:Phasin protein